MAARRQLWEEFDTGSRVIVSVRNALIVHCYFCVALLLLHLIPWTSVSMVSAQLPATISSYFYSRNCYVTNDTVKLIWLRACSACKDDLKSFSHHI